MFLMFRKESHLPQQEQECFMDYKIFTLYPSEWGIVGNDSCGYLQIVHSCDNSKETDRPAGF